DWNAVGELVPQGLAADNAAAARKAFLGGVDMDMVSSFYHDHLPELIKSGVAMQAELDEAVRHVLRVKIALGLFEHPYVDEANVTKAYYKPESLELAQTAAERSFVLLKNSNASGAPLLPLSKSTQTIALIGPLADDPSYPEGAPEGTGPRPSLTSELTRRLGEGHVIRSKGARILDGTDADISAAVDAAQKADV